RSISFSTLTSCNLVLVTVVTSVLSPSDRTLHHQQCRRLPPPETEHDGCHRIPSP
ncbi:hypothetical protein S83_004269, partial [Arachis hypogaea]